ncbi:hypothetical protein OBK27_13260 [Empedobacter falsenii]
MNPKTIFILVLFLIIGLVFTMTISKLLIKNFQTESDNSIYPTILSAMLLIGGIILLNSCLRTVQYTLDILVNQKFDFTKLELYKLLFIYFLVFGISFIVYYYISLYLYRIINLNNKDTLQSFELIIVGILFIGLCFLSLPFLEMIFNYYKPTVQTPFYR